MQKILPFLETEVVAASGKPRHLTVLGESFGGCLAIRLALAAPHIVSRLVLVRDLVPYKVCTLQCYF